MDSRYRDSLRRPRSLEIDRDCSRITRARDRPGLASRRGCQGYWRIPPSVGSSQPVLAKIQSHSTTLRLRGKTHGKKPLAKLQALDMVPAAPGFRRDLKS